MSHDEDEKAASALASPSTVVPPLSKHANANEKENSDKSSDVGRAGDSQDEVHAFARRDVTWTEDEERALVWRLGAFLQKRKKRALAW